MDPELNQTAIDENDAAEQAAFDSVFSDAPAASAPVPAAAPAAPAAAPAPAPAAPEEDEAVDPFADLPEPVRQVLARVTTLEHDVRTVTGRNAALQRKLDQFEQQGRAPAPAVVPPPAPAPYKAREIVRGELPEVAEAMDEFEQMLKERNAPPAPAPTAAPEPAPAPAQQTADMDPETAALAEVDPNWATKMNSTAFKLWLSSQPSEYQNTIMSTDKAIQVVGALKKFDGFQESVSARSRPAEDAAARRNTRAAASVAPAGGTRGNPSAGRKPMTGEEAFAWGFENPSGSLPRN